MFIQTVFEIDILIKRNSPKSFNKPYKKSLDGFAL